jgi:hypothetical protein
VKLLDQYRELHRDPAIYTGTSLLPHAGEIKQLCIKHKARTLLDYGCGKGMAYHQLGTHAWWGVKPTLYDPAVYMHSKKPGGQFDGVVCTDVLEHVPEDEVRVVFDDLFAYAVRFVFATICTRAANRKLPNGLNAHVTVQPEAWWSDLIKARMGKRNTYGRGLDVQIRYTT